MSELWSGAGGEPEKARNKSNRSVQITAACHEARKKMKHGVKKGVKK